MYLGHRKGEALRAHNHSVLVGRIDRETRKEEGVGVLTFPKRGPFEAHRRLIYEGLPLQPAPEVQGFQGFPLKNGMKVMGLKSLLRLVGWSSFTMKEFHRQFAVKEVG
jgi:hypothetical protein